MFACLFIVSSCVSTYEAGNKFNFSDINLIKKQSTTKEEILKMFGTPREREVGTNGDEKWLYASYISKKDDFTGDENISFKGLQIIFHKDVVYDFRKYEKYTSK